MSNTERMSVLVILAHSKYRKEKPLKQELAVMLAGSGFEVLVATPCRRFIALRLGMAIAASRPCQAVIVERLPGEPPLIPGGEMAKSLAAALAELKLSLPVWAVLLHPGNNQILSLETNTCELKLKLGGISDADLPERLLDNIKGSESE